MCNLNFQQKMKNLILMPVRLHDKHAEIWKRFWKCYHSCICVYIQNWESFKLITLCTCSLHLQKHNNDGLCGSIVSAQLFAKTLSAKCSFTLQPRAEKQWCILHTWQFLDTHQRRQQQIITSKQVRFTKQVTAPNTGLPYALQNLLSFSQMWIIFKTLSFQIWIQYCHVNVAQVRNILTSRGLMIIWSHLNA